MPLAHIALFVTLASGASALSFPQPATFEHVSQSHAAQYSGESDGESSEEAQNGHEEHSGCGAGSLGTGQCGSISPTVDDKGVELVFQSPGGASTRPALGGSGASGGTGAANDNNGGVECRPFASGVVCGALPKTGDPSEDAVPSIEDAARFLVADASHHMEPDGWVVTRLPANFFSPARPHTVNGELLGNPAQVRFTPIAWNWDYGDGNTARLTTGGASWGALGLPEFAHTPTAHIYTRAGEYTVRLSVTYRAEYSYGSGFVPIAGTITRPANELHIVARSAKTVLVDRDCTQAPSGPGC